MVRTYNEIGYNEHSASMSKFLSSVLVLKSLSYNEYCLQ